MFKDGLLLLLLPIPRSKPGALVKGPDRRATWYMFTGGENPENLEETHANMQSSHREALPQPGTKPSV